MSSPVSEADEGSGNKGPHVVDLVNVRVFPADETEAIGMTDGGFDTQNKTASWVDTRGQQTSVDLKSSAQVNQLCLASTYLCFAHAVYNYNPGNAFGRIIIIIIIIMEFLVRLLHQEHRCITVS